MSSKKDLRLFFTIILWNLLPSVYFLVRANLISFSGVNINILGQLEWFDLIDEILVTALTVPMYSLLKKSTSRQNFNVLTILFSIYLFFSIIVAIYMGTLTEFMKAEFATKFLLLQTLSLLISFITSIMVILFTLNNKIKIFYILIGIKLLCLTLSDILFIPHFKEYGATYSEICVNTLIGITAIILGFKVNILSLKNTEKDPDVNVKNWLRIGSFSGIQIFLDNFIYFAIIVRMVNAVSESGNYWMANNFIYGWLLVPVFALGEIIKKNNYEKLTFKNTWIYCLGITAFWLITLPLWKPFIAHGLAMDPKLIMPIVLPMSIFYLSFIICTVIDGFFISKGKTYCVTIISLIVNIGYYGIMYLLYCRNVFTLGMPFIICLFGFGIVVHMICSIVIYIIINRKK